MMMWPIHMGDIDTMMCQTPNVTCVTNVALEGKKIGSAMCTQGSHVAPSCLDDMMSSTSTLVGLKVHVASSMSH